MANIECVKCKKSMDEKNYYSYRTGEKMEICKKCLTMHMNCFEPDTFIWALKKMDLPYMAGEWNSIRDKAYAKDPDKLSDMAVFGKYIGKMRLGQYKDLTWADTERIDAEKQEKAKKAKEEADSYAESLKKDFEEGKISEAEYKTMADSVYLYEQDQREAESAAIQADYERRKRERAKGANLGSYDDPDFMSEEELSSELTEGLTEDDKLMLAMKWGRLYTPYQWILLEKKYQSMIDSFPIEDSDSEGTLILTCKTYLKMNEAIDSGDTETYTKLSRAYEQLRKSSCFTAAQNKKKESTDEISCLGKLVALCEKEGGFIPEWDISVPQDIVDTVIQDLKDYTKTLITEDASLAQQIENYLRKREIMEEMERNKKNGVDPTAMPEDYIKKMELDQLAYESDMEVQYGEDA